jgi:hypothetical protein
MVENTRKQVFHAFFGLFWGHLGTPMWTKKEYTEAQKWVGYMAQCLS